MHEHLPPYLLGRAGRVLDAWGSPSGDERAALDRRLADAVDVATRRVGRELAELVAADPEAQRATPLEVVRGSVREPTAVLAGAGVGAVARDEFEARALPDDRYGLAPRTFPDLGDDELGALHLAWGMAKAQALRSGRDRAL